MRYANKYDPLGTRQKMILHCFWDHEGRLTGPEVTAALKEKYHIPLSKSATNAMLRTLISRGYIEIVEKKGAAYLYRTTVTREELLAEELRWIQENDYNGSARALLVGVLKANVDNDDLEEAREILTRIKHE